MSRRSLIALILVALLTACATSDPDTAPGQMGRLESAAPEAAGFSAERLVRVTSAFKAEVDRGALPGVVIAVARRGKLVYHEAVGFQDKSAGTPMSRDAIFRLYSMTKPLTSVAAMILVEEGKVQLTDPVSKFLPAFSNLQVATTRREADGRTVNELAPASMPMLVHDLLRHTAGLAYGEVTPNAVVKEAYAKAGLFKPNVIDFDTRDLSPAEFTDRLSKLPLVGNPGQMWQYSIATDLLGRVVEVASGQRLSSFLEDRLFKPLAMKDTAFHVPAEKMARLAQPLARPTGGQFVSPQIDVSRTPGNDSGGAGAVGTAIDYLRFAQAMLNGGSLDGQRIVSRPTTQLMMSDHTGDRPSVPGLASELLLGTQGYGFGLGFLVRSGAGMAAIPGNAGEAMWGGYGGTYFWIDPKEQLVVVLMSQGPAATRAYYRRMIKALVYQAIMD